MKHLYITYTTEKLYHFSCQKCKGWWSIADWKKPYKKGPNYLACPHCKLLFMTIESEVRKKTNEKM